MTDSGLVLGLVFAATGIALWWTGVLARSGSLRRNPLVGIRLPPITRDDGTWERGHRAAAAPLVWAGWTSLALAVLLGVAPNEPVVAVIALVAGVAITALVGYAAVLARRAAGKA